VGLVGLQPSAGARLCSIHCSSHQPVLQPRYASNSSRHEGLLPAATRSRWVFWLTIAHHLLWRNLLPLFCMLPDPEILSLQGLELPISLFCLCLHHSLPHFLILKGLLQPGRRTDIFRVAIFTTTSPFPRDSRGLKVGTCSKTCIVMSTSARHSSLNAVTSQLPMPDFYDVKCR
jgi:hypothetical protein